MRRNRFEIVGALEPGRSVESPARALNQLEVLIRADVGGSLEKHVLEQMRKASPSTALIRRADVIPEVYRYDGRGVILGKGDEQPVVQLVRFYRNSHCRKLPAMQRLWNPLATT